MFHIFNLKTNTGRHLKRRVRSLRTGDSSRLARRDDNEARGRQRPPPERAARRHPHAFALVHGLDRDTERRELIEDVAGHDAVEGLGSAEERHGLLWDIEVVRMPVDVEAEGVAPAVEAIRRDAR